MDGTRAGFRWRPWLALLPVLVLAGWAWQPILALPMAGEDYTVLSRLNQGLLATEHVYRPLLDVWLGRLHGLFGVAAAAPYRVAILVVHLVNAALVFAIGRALLRSSLAAGVAAGLFVLGAACTDAVVWIAAANRPLSALGGLCVLLGLAHFERRPLAGIGTCVGGLLFQGGFNEEVYGSAMLAAAFLGFQALRDPRVRWQSLVVVGFALGGLLVHYYVLRRMPESKGRFILPELIPATVEARSRTIVFGFGIPAALWWVVPSASVLVLAALRRARAASLLLGAWCASFVPYAMSPHADFRAYPTQAPTALLVAGALFVLVERLASRASLRRLAFAGSLALVVVGTTPPRDARLARWRSALAEIGVVAPQVPALAREHPDAIPVLVNLETTTLGPFLYWYGRTGPTGLQSIGFLDAPTGFVRLANLPSGPWFGRRCEGSIGWIEPERYLAGRPSIEPLRLYARARAVGSLAEARALLASGAVDLTSEVLLEAPGSALAALAESAGLDPRSPGRLEVVVPFSYDLKQKRAHLEVRVQAEAELVLAVLADWSFDPLYRIPLDQTMFSNVLEPRIFSMSARVRGESGELGSFYADGFGFGALVPAGDHVIVLDWRVPIAVR